MKMYLLPIPLNLACNFTCPSHRNAEFPKPQEVQEQKIYSNLHPRYLWLGAYAQENCLINRIPSPENYTRFVADSGSFASWLQHIPLKVVQPEVYLYNGALKGNQSVHAAVINIDVGEKDLQQCADAVMRLRAEYLLATGKEADISFNFTSGHACRYQEWTKGYRPKIAGNNVTFVQSEREDYSYTNFTKYMEMIFNYCGTFSLSKEMKTKEISEIQIGDVFIQGGFPGHAVIVMDLATHEATGETIFLLAQSYMPAQDMHILKNFNNDALSPWFSANFVAQLNTPEWTFQKSDLKQF